MPLTAARAKPHRKGSAVSNFAEISDRAANFAEMTASNES
jgi:hypothetical protein